MMFDSNPLGQYPHALCIYFPQAFAPSDREARYERPLRELLPAGLARVDGGGTWLHGASDVWIFANELVSTLALVRAQLIGLGVPQGTQVQYEIGGQAMHDEFRAGGWVTGLRAITNMLGLSIAA